MLIYIFSQVLLKGIMSAILIIIYFTLMAQINSTLEIPQAIIGTILRDGTP